jgi:hypothetical protein
VLYRLFLKAIFKSIYYVMRFSEFARFLESLENTSSRLQMYELLGTLLKKLVRRKSLPSLTSAKAVCCQPSRASKQA